MSPPLRDHAPPAFNHPQKDLATGRDILRSQYPKQGAGAQAALLLFVCFALWDDKRERNIGNKGLPWGLLSSLLSRLPVGSGAVLGGGGSFCLYAIGCFSLSLSLFLKTYFLNLFT